MSDIKDAMKLLTPEQKHQIDIITKMSVQQIQVESQNIVNHLNVLANEAMLATGNVKLTPQLHAEAVMYVQQKIQEMYDFLSQRQASMSAILLTAMKQKQKEDISP